MFRILSFFRVLSFFPSDFALCALPNPVKGEFVVSTMYKSHFCIQISLDPRIVHSIILFSFCSSDYANRNAERKQKIKYAGGTKEAEKMAKGKSFLLQSVFSAMFPPLESVSSVQEPAWSHRARKMNSFCFSRACSASCRRRMEQNNDKN